MVYSTASHVWIFFVLWRRYIGRKIYWFRSVRNASIGFKLWSCSPVWSWACGFDPFETLCDGVVCFLFLSSLRLWFKNRWLEIVPVVQIIHALSLCCLKLELCSLNPMEGFVPVHEPTTSSFAKTAFRALWVGCSCGQDDDHERRSLFCAGQ